MAFSLRRQMPEAGSLRNKTGPFTNIPNAHVRVQFTKSPGATLSSQGQVVGETTLKLTNHSGYRDTCLSVSVDYERPSPTTAE